jgi:hypothetical protein
VAGSWNSERRNGKENKVVEVNGGVSVLKRGRKQRGFHRKEMERTEINKVLSKKNSNSKLRKRSRRQEKKVVVESDKSKNGK